MIIVVLRLFCEKKGNWKGFHAHELLVGCPHLSNGVDEVRREGSRNSSVNNPGATWGGAILYLWNKYSVFVT